MIKKYSKKTESAKSLESLESVIANIQLALEDVNWRRASESIFDEDVDKFTRDSVLKDSIQLYRSNPSYKQIIALNKAFVLGAEGFHRPVVENVLIQYVIDKILNHKENKRTFSGYKAQSRMIASKGIKGEIFFKIYVNMTTGEIIIRQEKDTSRVVEVISQTGDSDYVLYYKYKQCQKEYDYKTEKTSTKDAIVLIPDIMNDDIEDTNKRGVKSADGNVHVFGYLAKFGDDAENDGRGFPEYIQIFKFLKAHVGVCEDSTTMLKALSRFAWKKKFKGEMNRALLDGQKSLVQSLTQSNTVSKTTPATASTLLETENVENQQVEVKHNGAAFWDTSRILMQQIAAGAQKSEHYFGNPADANLATATSMELPMLKDFQSQQAEFAEVIETVLTFCVLKYTSINKSSFIVAKAKDADYEMPDNATLTQMKREVESLSWETLSLAVRMPEILDKEVQSLILAIINAYNASLIGDSDAAYLIYGLLGYHNVDEKISALFGDTHEPMTSAGNDPLASADNLKKMTDMINQKVADKKSADDKVAATKKSDNNAD